MAASPVLDKIRGETRTSWRKAAQNALASLTAHAAPTPADVPPLLDFIPEVSPHLESPVWLQELADALTRAAHEPIKLLISTPPQHGKSTLVFHFIAWVLKQWPTPILYLTYNEDFATSQMRLAKATAHDAGVPFTPNNTNLREWTTTLGGRLYATGVGGATTGRPGGIVVIDDPIKDWESARSKRTRDIADDWLQAVVLTRMHPGSSIIVVQTRWHVDDLYGRLEKRGWDVINLPALSDEGEALWPEGRPAEWLESQREQMTAQKFAALYQGKPRPDGDAIFKDAELVDEVPSRGHYTIGVDLAYTAKTSADYSVAVVLCRHGNPKDRRWTVVHMERVQCQAPEFVLTLRRIMDRFPGAPMRWYASGTEAGAAQFITRQGVPLQVMPAIAGRDKRVRAEATAAAWNAQKIWVPRDRSWTGTLLDELHAFTGDNDPHDDIVDALAAAYDLSAEGGQTIEVETRPNHTRRAVRKLRDYY